MSWYYDYYLAIQNRETKKIDMFGPFDNKGKLHSIICRSRSFASDLWESFYPVNDLLTEEAMKTLWSHVGDSDFTKDELKWLKQNTSYLPYKELPDGNYLKEGYFLIDDITNYEENHDSDVFYEHLTPTAYTLKMQNELKFGPPKPKKNEWGEEYTEHSCSEYAFYIYPDYSSKEYESSLIRDVANMLAPFGFDDDGIDDKYEMVVLCTQG